MYSNHVLVLKNTCSVDNLCEVSGCVYLQEKLLVRNDWKSIWKILRYVKCNIPHSTLNMKMIHPARINDNGQL